MMTNLSGTCRKLLKEYPYRSVVYIRAVGRLKPVFMFLVICLWTVLLPILVVPILSQDRLGVGSPFGIKMTTEYGNASVQVHHSVKGLKVFDTDC
jgi:hypothetical protein